MADKKKYEHQLLTDLKGRVDSRVQEMIEAKWSLLSALRQPEGRLLVRYMKRRVRTLAFMGVASLFSTAIEAVRLIFLLVTLQLIVGGSGLTGSSTGLLGFTINLPFVSDLHGTGGLVIALGALVVLTAIEQGITLGLNVLSYRTQGGFMLEVRRDLLDKLLSLEPGYFTDVKAGNLTYLQNTIVNRFSGLVPACMTALQAALNLLASLVILALISPVLTLLLVGLAGLSVALMGLLRHRARLLSFQSENASREAATHFLEMVQGIRLVKLLGGQTERVRSRYLGLAEDTVTTMTRLGVFGGFTSSVGVVTSAVALVMLAVGLTVFGDFGPGSNAAAALGFLAIAMRAVENVRVVSASQLQLSTMVPHFLMVAEFILDDRYVETSAHISLPAIERIEDRLAVEELKFEYEPGHPVLDDVSLSFGMGTITALIGPSGSGKTTLTEMLAGYRAPQQGRVLVDGHELAQRDIGSYRERVGYVTQDTVLFHDTIRHNLTFLNPDANEEQIDRALKMAAAEEFVNQDGRGLESLLGERGLKISGGERQRIALARMFLQEPSVFLLDEATNGLDLYTEARIFARLMEMREDKIIVVVAHRLSSIARFDNIVVMHGGRVVEEGTHEELLAAEGLYFHLYGLQEYAPEASLDSLAAH